MTTTLHYGTRSSLELNLPSGVLVAHCGRPDTAIPGAGIAAAGAAGEPAIAIAQALDVPLDYPPLAQSAVPGDKVVLALGEGVPRAAEIVTALVDRIVEAGVAIGDIALLRSRPDMQADPAAPLALLADRREPIKLLVHDPLDRNRLSYLAASTEGKPIYVNRALAEADLTIPIGCLRPEGSPAYYGAYSDVFPAFSDAKTIQRYRSPIASESPVQMRRFRREVEEVGWLLGLHYLVQVVPGVPEELLAIFAGRSASVVRAGSERCRQAWTFQVPSRASLVLAAISGPASQQTWTNVARALMAAAHLVEEGGAIALCTELEEPLGPALQALRGAENPDLVLRHITHDRPSDTLVSVQLAHAIERGRVYLLSRLDESLVEDLGMAPISDPEQLTRLAARYSSCIVLENAQFARATAENEPERPSESEALESLLEDAREEFD